HAVGVMQPRDSVELHNIPLLITGKLNKREDTGELTNEIKGYEAKSASTGQPQQAPVTSNTPPWQRSRGRRGDASSVPTQREPLLASGRAAHLDQPGGPDVPRQRLRPPGPGRRQRPPQAALWRPHRAGDGRLPARSATA